MNHPVASKALKPLNEPRVPPYKVAAVVFLTTIAVITGLVYVQFRGGFTPPPR